MLLIIQIAAGIVIGGLVLAFLISFINAYYSRNYYEQIYVKRFLQNIFGILLIIALIILGLFYQPQKTIFGLIAVGVPLALLLVITLAVLFVFRNRDYELRLLFNWWNSLPKLLTKSAEIILVIGLIMTGIVVNIYFGF